MRHDELRAGDSEASLCSSAIGGSCHSVDEPPRTPGLIRLQEYDTGTVGDSVTLTVETEEKAELDSHQDLMKHDDEYEGNCRRRAKTWLDDYVHRCFTRKLLHKRVPILDWGPKYNVSWAIADLLAGITVGLTVIPQAIAYANIAGLPAEFGLYSSFIGCFVYAIFGSCRDSAIGPTAIAAILTRENIHEHGPEFAILLCFISGCVELLMGILQLGFLIDFISGPVSVGFTSAAAIIIATSQLKDILGLSAPGSNFIEMCSQLVEHFSETRLWDAALGVFCMGVLLGLRKLKDLEFGPKEETARKSWQRSLNRVIWLLTTSRNIIVVVSCAAFAAVLSDKGIYPFLLTGNVKAGLPGVRLPPTSARVGNRTYSFLEMCATLGTGTIVIPLLAVLENIAICKAFSGGRAVDATQEMLALGLSNMASAFVSSMPVTGSLSRGAVNHASGVATPLGGLYTGILVMLSLQFFTPYFFYIPRSSLAAVIIAAVVFMVEIRVLKPMWQTKKADVVPALATFLSCLLIRLELGIIIGIGVNVLFLLYASARPSVSVVGALTDTGVEYVLVTPDRSLAFPSVEYVRNLVTKAGVKAGASRVPVVIDSRHIQGADYTAAKGMKTLIDDFAVRGQPLLFYNLKPSVVNVFRAVKPRELRVCQTEHDLHELLNDYANNISHIKTSATPEHTAS